MENPLFPEVSGNSGKFRQNLWFGTKRPRVSEPNVSPVGCPAKPEERRANQSKRAMRPLQGSSAKIEIAARSGIPPLRPKNGHPLRVSVFCALRVGIEHTSAAANERSGSPVGKSSKGDSDSSLLARNEYRCCSKASVRRLSERYRIPPLRLPKALIFIRFQVFCF